MDTFILIPKPHSSGSKCQYLGGGSAFSVGTYVFKYNMSRLRCHGMAIRGVSAVRSDCVVVQAWPGGHTEGGREGRCHSQASPGFPSVPVPVGPSLISTPHHTAMAR